MERDLQLLEALSRVKVGQTFCFNYLQGSVLPRTSWTTSFYKRYHYENRRTMVDELQQLITRISRRQYQLEDIHNKELVTSLLLAAEGVRNLALTYEDDPEINRLLNLEAARMAEVHSELYNKLIQDVIIVAVKGQIPNFQQQHQIPQQIMEKENTEVMVEPPTPESRQEPVETPTSQVSVPSQEIGLDTRIKRTQKSRNIPLQRLQVNRFYGGPQGV